MHACTRRSARTFAICTRACFTLRMRINMYTSRARTTDADARDRGVAVHHRVPLHVFPVALPPSTVALVAGALVHLQTFAYKYTGYLDGWYAD